MVERNYKKPFVCNMNKENSKKYFGVVKYFFRLTYTTGVISVPICSVHWINFEIIQDSVNCSIGRIKRHWWDSLTDHEDKDIQEQNFVSFNDIHHRYALSYIPEPKENVHYIQMAFIALDSEKLRERDDDKVHVDFGDNKFQHYLGNFKTYRVEENEQDNDDQIALDIRSYVSDTNIEAVKQYIPKSILTFIGGSLNAI